MRYPRVFAATFIAAFVVFIGISAGFGGRAEAGQATAGYAAPSIAVEQQGQGEPAQSLRELLGLPGAKSGGIYTVWALQKNTTVYGSTYVDDEEKIDLKGYTLAIYGDLTINGHKVVPGGPADPGALYIDGGKLILKQDPKDTKNITGNLIIKGGLLIMQKAADSVEMQRSLIACGNNETGLLTAGQVRVGGHFLQLSDNSPYSYNETGSHATVFGGANKLVSFTAPLNSGILNLSLSTGTTFTSANTDIPVVWTYKDAGGSSRSQNYIYHTTGGTFLCLKKNLAANYSITVPNLYYMGAQGAYTLSVTGNLIAPAGAAMNVTGSISAKGMYAVGTVNMASAGKAITASDFFSVTDTGALNLSTGSIVTKAFYTAQGNIIASGVSGANITVNRYTDADITVSGTPVNFSGSPGARNLTVNGSMAVPAAAAFTLGKGAVSVTGNIDATGALIMKDASAKLHTGGDFFTRSASSVFTAGALEVGGMFRQVSGAAFAAGSGFNVKLLALKSPWGAVFEDPAACWFSGLALPSHPASPISSGSVLSVRCDLASDLAFPASPALYYAGKLNGHRLTAGSLVIPAGKIVTIGSGRLDVSGDLDVKGLLDMQDSTGAAVVGGTFMAEGSDSSGHLTKGYLALKGNFAQRSAVSPRSFCPGSAHRALLLGGAAQQVSFESPADPGSPIDTAAGKSWFGSLTNCNPDISVAAVPAMAKEVSGTKLSYVSVSAGGHQLPSLRDTSHGSVRYEVAVPVNAGTITLSSKLQYPNQRVVTKVNGIPVQGDDNDGTGDIAVNPNSTTTVTLEVLSAAGLPNATAGAPFSMTYTVILQPQNPTLSSPGFAYAMDKSFDPDTDGQDYLVTVPAKDGTFKLSPVLANPNASIKFSCGGEESEGASFTHVISPGSAVTVNVTVSSYNNSLSPAITKTYCFTFLRQTILDGITLASGGNPVSLNEVFNDEVYAYTADVTAADWAIVVTPMKGNGCASCKINGSTADATTLFPPLGGSASATITLSDSTGTLTKTYVLTVKRAPLLKSLSVSYMAGGTSIRKLLPFSSGTNAYTLDVPVDCTSIAASAVKSINGISLVWDGNNPDISPGGQAVVKLTASAGPDAAHQAATYTVAIRKHLLSGLNLSPARALNAPFNRDPAVASAVTIPYTWPSVTLLPVGNAVSASAISYSYYVGTVGSGTKLPSGTITLGQGETKTICILAASGSATETYRVVISREMSNNPNLKSMGASTGWLSPAFSAAAAAYTLTIPETVSSVTLKPAVEETTSKYKIDSLAYNTPRAIALSLNGSATAKIVVTALRGNTRTYTVNVRRLSILSGFSAQPVYSGYPSLSPGGTNRMAIAYTLSMPASVKIEVKKGTKWYSILSRADNAPGAKSFSWDGKVSGTYLAAGTYTIRVTPYYASKAGTQKSLNVKILSKPGVSVTSLTPTVFTANGTNKLKAGVKWTRLTNVKVEVINSAGKVMKCIYTAANKPRASVTLYWDGKDTSGLLVAAGQHRLKVTCGGAAPVYKAFTVKR